MAAILNLTHDQGTTFKRILRIGHKPVPTDPLVPIDLTGYSFKGQIRKKIGGPLTLSFTFTVSNQATNEGEVEMSIDADLTATIPTKAPTVYVYDVEMTDPSGNVSRMFEGKYTLRPEVTLG